MLQARAVEGRFRTLRNWANLALIAVLFAVPWIRIAGEPLVLLDIPARRFHVFGLVIFPQELFFLWLIVAGVALALFMFTALAGRVWCGWSCPQTVFTDVFAGVARVLQGWGGPRRPTQVAKWRTGLTHVVWLALCAVIGFHLVAYFVSPYELLPSLADAESHPSAASFFAVATAFCYADFVWVKQSFCKYLCPYARFQGVLFDRDTLVVAYAPERGEPRGKKGSVEGDCVDCGLCVQVCPTGIDIRDGLQLECIACTQCIDACDGVMEKVGREPGLISYRSWVADQGERAMRLLRPRVLIYGVGLVATCVVFVVMLAGRVPMGFEVVHNRDSLYSRAADGRVGNAFTLFVENRAREERSFQLRVEGPDQGFELVAGVNPVAVEPTAAVELRVFVLAPKDWKTGPTGDELSFVLEPVDTPKSRLVRRARFLAPSGMGGQGGS